MRLTFLGAAEEVTGSMLRLDAESGSVLIDCGMFQGRRQESRRRNRQLPREAVHADSVILTHAHIDHSGNLPTLVKAGYPGSIYATPATHDLATYMLRDAAHIQEADADYLNRKHARDPDHDPIEPLYVDADAVRALERFVAIPYHRRFSPIPGVEAMFIDSGHILGSAQVVLDVKEGGTQRRIVVTGDLGRAKLPILRDPEIPKGPLDYVVMESTYGDRVHGPAARMHEDLERVVHRSIERGGKIIVPAFAVGRTQELLYVLHDLHRRGRVPAIPVFVDSPLAVDVTSVFRKHSEIYDADARAFLEDRGDLFSFEGLRFCRSREESMAINEVEGPAIIISAAGMCEAGRVLHHLRNKVEDERNTILIVGWMAQHTLGRRLVERQKRVRIWGVERDLRARVEVLNAFSAHADRDDLLAFAEACGASTRKFFLVHGEPDPQRTLAAAMKQRGMRVHIPQRNEAVELE